MKGIRELLAQLKVFAQFDVAVVDKLEEIERRLYALEEDNKRNTATVRSLETRYSEMLMILKDIKRNGASC